MSLRQIQLPDYLSVLGDIIAQSFQYPENASWSIQTDEKEQFVGMIRNLKRIWPLIRTIMAISPALREIIQGFVWEEEGRSIGAIMVQRRGSTNNWVIGNVGVLPDYRRQGIARALVEASLERIRHLGGKVAILSVIDGNVPAYNLYRELGFIEYDRTLDYETHSAGISEVPILPDGFFQIPVTSSDWQLRYEFEKRISRESAVGFEPVEVGLYRQSIWMRVLRSIATVAQGLRDTEFMVRDQRGGDSVAWGRYAMPRRREGIAHLLPRIDPSFPELGKYMIGKA
jgi:ribosomal protein S18 acetylase RimI-like enzyme